MATQNQDASLNSDQITALSSTLVQARRSTSLLPEFPGPVPKTLQDAYAVQDLSRSSWEDTVSGWKVGGLPGNGRAVHGVDWLAGPIYNKSVVYADGENTAEMPVHPGFAAVEAEFVFKLGETAEQDRLFIGVEIASSPVKALNDYGGTAIISDFGNNNGLLVGAEITNWQSREWPEFAITTTIDGALIGTRELDAMADSSLSALAFIRDHARKRGMDLPAGTFISSGAQTGVHEAEIGSHSVIKFGPFGTMQIKLVPANPTA